jgi:hypothetical protein
MVLAALSLSGCGAGHKVAHRSPSSANTVPASTVLIQDDPECRNGRDKFNNSPCTPAPSAAADSAKSAGLTDSSTCTDWNNASASERETYDATLQSPSAMSPSAFLGLLNTECQGFAADPSLASGTTLATIVQQLGGSTDASSPPAAVPANGVHCTGPGGGFPCYDSNGNPISDGPATTPPPGSGSPSSASSTSFPGPATAGGGWTPCSVPAGQDQYSVSANSPGCGFGAAVETNVLRTSGQNTASGSSEPTIPSEVTVQYNGQTYSVTCRGVFLQGGTLAECSDASPWVLVYFDSAR